MNPSDSLLFYCQHSVGMGHLMRSLALTRALASRFHVTFVTGGALPRRVSVPPQVRIVRLPPVGADETGRLVSRDGRRTIERALADRRRILLATCQAIRPRVIVVELFPFGRRKFMAELEPMLEEARREGSAGPLVYSSIRDILVGRDDRQFEHDARAARILDRYFHGVFVHSDPSFARLEESLAPGVEVPVPVYYTGFVHEAKPACSRRIRRGSIIVSAGGGMVGEALLRCAAEAHQLLPAEGRPPLTLLAGPFLPQPAWKALQDLVRGRTDVMLRRSVPDLAAELAGAAGSISQCGYNTAMDLLHSGVPALVVPFGGAAEDEQLRRARRLESMGALRVLVPAELTPGRLAAEMAALPTFRPSPAGIALDGAERTAALVASLVRTRACARETAAVMASRIAS